MPVNTDDSSSGHCGVGKRLLDPLLSRPVLGLPVLVEDAAGDVAAAIGVRDHVAHERTGLPTSDGTSSNPAK